MALGLDCDVDWLWQSLKLTNYLFLGATLGVVEVVYLGDGPLGELSP